MNFFKKMKLEPAIIWKPVTCQRITSKNTWPQWVDTWVRDTLKWYCSPDTVLCKRNANKILCFSFFVLAKIRQNFATKFRQSAREVSSSQTNFRCHLGEISHPLRRNFVGAKIRNCEISQARKFAAARFPQSGILLAVGEGCNENLLFGPL